MVDGVFGVGLLFRDRIVGLLFHGGYRLSRKISRRKNLNYAKAFSENAKAFLKNVNAFLEGPTLHSKSIGVLAY